MICLTTSVGALRLIEGQQATLEFPPKEDLLNQSLMNSHLESIPSLRSFTTRSLAGSDLESLGWETNGALDAEFLGLGTLNKLLADLLEGGDLSAGEGDADLVGFLKIRSVCASKMLDWKRTGPSPKSFSFW